MTPRFGHARQRGLHLELSAPQARRLERLTVATELGPEPQDLGVGRSPRPRSRERPVPGCGLPELVLRIGDPTLELLNLLPDLPEIQLPGGPILPSPSLRRDHGTDGDLQEAVEIEAGATLSCFIWGKGTGPVGICRTGGLRREEEQYSGKGDPTHRLALYENETGIRQGGRQLDRRMEGPRRPVGGES